MITQYQRVFLSQYLLIFLLFSTDLWAVQDKSPWSKNARVSIGGDDNISQAEQPTDIAEDQFAELSTSLAFSRLLTIQQGYTIAGFAKLKGHKKFDALDSQTLGLSAIYRIQPNLGFTQPFYQVSATLRVEEFEFDQRDNTTLELRAQFKKRFTDKLTVALGVEQQSIESEGTVFDLDRSKVFTNFDLSLNSSSVLYFTYNYIDGDSVSTGFLNRQEFKVVNYAEEREQDLAFSKELTGTWMAYKLPTKTQTVKLGLNKRMPREMSIDISALMIEAKGEGDNNYQRVISRFSLSKRF